MVSNDAADQFLSAPWMADLDAATRRAVLNVLVEGDADAGTVLLSQDEPNDRITFLIAGEAELVRAEKGQPPETLTTLKAPAVVGEDSFYGRRPSPATVRTTSPARFLTLDRHAHELLRRADPQAAEQLAVASVRALAALVDDALERRMTVAPASSTNGHNGHKLNEWATFRARVLEESGI